MCTAGCFEMDLAAEWLYVMLVLEVQNSTLGFNCILEVDLSKVESKKNRAVSQCISVVQFLLIKYDILRSTPLSSYLHSSIYTDSPFSLLAIPLHILLLLPQRTRRDLALLAC